MMQPLPSDANVPDAEFAPIFLRYPASNVGNASHEHECLA
jgi:hypothetical protein